MPRLLLLLLALLAAIAGVQAQVVTAGPDSAQVNTAPITKKQRSAADSAARTERLFGFRVTRPQKAGLLALVPGAGQIYNKRYWKLPLVYGLVGGLGYTLHFQQQYFREYADADKFLLSQPGGTSPLVLDKKRFPRARLERTAANVTVNLRFYRRYRDLFILVNAFGYGLQILDAVVDAHLYNFDVSDDLTLHWEPALLPAAGQPLPGVGFTASLRMKN